MQLFTHFTANDVQLEPFPFKRELSMQAYLIENEGVLALDKDTFSNVEIIETELALQNGRSSKAIASDGRIDILATYSQEYIAIVELKLGELTMNHLNQLKDYLKVKEELLKKYKNIPNKEIIKNPKWIGVLVGSSIESNLANEINTHQDGNFFLAALTIQRFRGANGSIYVTTNTYFNQIRAARDTKKYTFNDNSYGKGRLVLAVVKYYIAQYPNSNYSDLLKIFPNSLQGRSGVFTKAQDALNVKEITGIKRHFINPIELIKLSDSEIAVSDQWGKGNLPKFIKNWNSLMTNKKICV